MRSFWSRTPMLRVMFAMIAGISLEIACNYRFHPSIKVAELIASIFLISVAVVVVVARLKNVTLAYRLRMYNGLALNISIVAFAWLLAWFTCEKNYTEHFSNFLASENVLVAQINEPPVVRGKVVMANALVKEVSNVNGIYPTSGNIQLSILKDSSSEELSYGDVLLIKSKPDTIDGPKNPYERDYKAFLALHNICNKAFVNHYEWRLFAKSQGNPVLAAAYNLRTGFLKIIARYVTGKDDFGAASSIMLGYREYINFDLYQAYASAGTVQILNVSGLHVLVMFFMLNFFLQWMDKRGRKMVLAKTILIIAFIWFYACLTGLTVPVIRCATMFTLIQLGRAFILNANRYNIIAASAVLLMLFNPFVLTDAGFQLSYLAVFGIYYLQPKIAGLFIVKIPEGPHYQKQNNWLLKPVTFILHDMLWFLFKIVDWLWQLMAASIAVQIAVFPLCLFYFYQFPNLFLISNIIVIPLGSLLLFTGTVLFAVGRIPFVNNVTGWVFSHIVTVLNKFIFWIDNLPFVNTRAVSVSIAEVALLYLLIILLCWLTEERKNKVLISALTVVLLLCSFRSYKTTHQAGQQQIVVYSVPKQKAIAFIADRNLYYDFDSTLLNDEANMFYHVNHHWWESGIQHKMQICDTGQTIAPGIYSNRIAQGRIVLFEDRKILIVDSVSKFEYAGLKIKLKADLVILSGNIRIPVSAIKKSVDFDGVVLDSKCRPDICKLWKTVCARLDIDYWDVNTQGAYVWNLRTNKIATCN